MKKESKYVEVRTFRRGEPKPVRFSLPQTASPFGDTLENAGFERGHIRILANDPDRIVRVGYLRASNVEDARATINTTQAVFSSLEEFGISIPPRDCFLGRLQHGGPELIFTVTKRVYGDNLEKFKPNVFDPNILKNDFEGFFSSLAHYYHHVAQHGGPFYSDLVTAQFVYGRLLGQEEDNIYLVDIEPDVFGIYNKANGRPSNYPFYTVLRNLALMTKNMESKLGTRLESSRLSLENLINCIPNSVINLDIQSVRNFVKS